MSSDNYILKITRMVMAGTRRWNSQKVTSLVILTPRLLMVMIFTSLVGLPISRTFLSRSIKITQKTGKP
jgi:hypothetical protein